MRSQKINIDGTPIALKQIDHKPGENKVKATILFNESVFSVKESGVELQEGEVPSGLLVRLKIHLGVYFRPGHGKRPNNTSYADN